MSSGQRPRIVVVGLGPGSHDHVTVETREAIARAEHRYLRTAIHPSADLVPDATTFDHLYDAADTFDDVYTDIASSLIRAAGEHGEILYAVPGSPLVLERTVRYLCEADDVELVLLPAMSFLDVAWARLGVDPVDAGVRLVDGHEFATAAAGERGPLLVAHTHANWVLSDIKLAVDEAAGDEAVTILHALGTPDEQIVEVAWADLDRTIDANHLTSLWIPNLAAPVGAAYVRFHALTRTLREQCPWDIEQTHDSLIPHLLEETYEVVDAIHALDDAETAATAAIAAAQAVIDAQQAIIDNPASTANQKRDARIEQVLGLANKERAKLKVDKADAIIKIAVARLDKATAIVALELLRRDKDLTQDAADLMRAANALLKLALSDLDDTDGT